MLITFQLNSQPWSPRSLPELAFQSILIRPTYFPQRNFKQIVARAFSPTSLCSMYQDSSSREGNDKKEKKERNIYTFALRSSWSK